MKITKEVIAIAALTVIAVVAMWKGYSEHFVWGIVVAIGTIAGYQIGFADATHKYQIREKVPYYWRKLISSACYLVGMFLLGEHLWSHGTTWDWTFPPGHELYGLIIIVVGILVGIKAERS